jgi:hypothetical protein
MTRLHAMAAILALSVAVTAPASAQQDGSPAPINGLIFLINTQADAEIDGLLRWEQELKARGLTAMIKASTPVLETYPEVFRRLAAEGHEIIGGHPGICWDMPYEEQVAAIGSVKQYMERLTGKPMRVFGGCTYFSSDENTVRAAEALGVPYVLARGTEDVRALIYKPAEYDVGIIEVSNVEFAEMGRGSLCDVSLYSRGATEEDFARVFAESVARHPDSMILVSHPHVGGAKAGYWQVYEDALASEDFTWRTFDAFLDTLTVVERPYAEIPENREVEYLEPKPIVPLEELADLPEIGDKIVMFHNGAGPMCREAEAFVDALDYPVEEHLSGEKNFFALLDSYRARFPDSEGVSASYEYFPIIFIEDRAFSGFNEEVRKAIEAEIGD